MPKLTINLSGDEKKIISKRAKKNLMSLREQIEDIVRKSAVRTKSAKKGYNSRTDDRLVAIFSREKRGRKKGKVKAKPTRGPRKGKGK